MNGIGNIQDRLKYIYESAQSRMKFHPEITEKYKKIIQEYPFYESEGEALKAASNMVNPATPVLIMVNLERDEEFFYFGNHYIVTDDNKIKQAAEYIGMFDLPIGAIDGHIVPWAI